MQFLDLEVRNGIGPARQELLEAGLCVLLRIEEELDAHGDEVHRVLGLGVILGDEGFLLGSQLLEVVPGQLTPLEDLTADLELVLSLLEFLTETLHRSSLGV